MDLKAFAEIGEIDGMKILFTQDGGEVKGSYIGIDPESNVISFTVEKEGNEGCRIHQLISLVSALIKKENELNPDKGEIQYNAESIKHLWLASRYQKAKEKGI